MRVPGLLAILFLAVPAAAGPHYNYVHAPGKGIYFGHISYCDLKGDSLDPLVVANEHAEVAVVNFPLAPGSRIATTTGRRCEAQFDTGTVMRLDGATGVRIETILAKALVSHETLTNIQLETGRVRVLYRDYDSFEVFQILTANAAIKLGRAALVEVEFRESGETRASVRSGGAQILYGPSAEKMRTRKLKAGEIARVDRNGALLVDVWSAELDEAFGAWNQELSTRHGERHRGNGLPKPIERHPRAVLDFAQRFSDPYGEWIWSDSYGYVWRPYLNSDATWRPYQRGRWVPVNSQLFWVPDEPWGWVPYHLGLWHWDTTHAWMWIPGSAFSPAWVSWSSCSDALYFRPLSLFDWSNRGRPRAGYYGPYGSYGPYGPYGYRHLCGDYPGSGAQAVVAVNSGVPQPSPDNTGDEEKTNPVPWRQDPSLPKLPAEIEKVAERAIKLMAEAEVHASLQRIQESGVVAQLPAERDKVDLPLALWPSTGNGRLLDWNGDVRAARRVEGHASVQRIQESGVVAQLPTARDKLDFPVSQSPSSGSGRFLDWNSDVRAARRVEGHIVYSSVNNAVRCDDCRMPLPKPEWQSPFASADRSSGANTGSTTGSDGGGSGSSSSAGQPSSVDKLSSAGERTGGGGTAERDRIR